MLISLMIHGFVLLSISLTEFYFLVDSIKSESLIEIGTAI